MRLIIVLAGLLVSVSASAEPRLFRIDPSHFSIAFSADHIGYGPTRGLFLKGSGSFMFDEETGTVSDAVIAVEAASVFSNDKRRDDHLRSADFLDAKEYPEIRFELTEAAALSAETGTVTGNLTILGVTKPVTADVTLNKIGPYPFGDAYVAGISARTVIRRSDWGMTYAVENGWVGDEVTLEIDLEAVRQEEG